MFLEQINRRLDAKIKARSLFKPIVEPMTKEGKTIAIKAPERLYERLQAQMQKHGVKTIKEMVFVAAQVGLAVLEDER